MKSEDIKTGDEIELMDLFLALERRKWLILGVIFISVTAAFCLVIFHQQKAIRTEMVVSLNFKEPGKNIYPDGTIFRAKDIIAPKILESIDTNTNLNNYISVQIDMTDPLVNAFFNPATGKPLSTLLAEDYLNKYKIILFEPDTPLFNSDKQRQEVLARVIEIFKIKNADKFVYASTLSLKFLEDYINNQEYTDAIQGFGKAVQYIQAFLDKNKIWLESFRSEKINYGFFEIKEKLQKLETVDLKDTTFLIKNFNLVKNKQRLIFQNKAEQKNLETSLKTFLIAKKENERIAGTYLDLFNTLDQDSEKIKTWLELENVTLSSASANGINTNYYPVHLLEKYLYSKIIAIQNDTQIDRLKDKMELIASNGGDMKLVEEEVTKRLEIILKQILNLSEKAAILWNEFFQLNPDQLIDARIKGPEYSAHSKYPLKKTLLLAFAGSLLFSLVLAVLADYVIQYKKTVE